MFKIGRTGRQQARRCRVNSRLDDRSCACQEAKRVKRYAHTYQDGPNDPLGRQAPPQPLNHGATHWPPSPDCKLAPPGRRRLKSRSPAALGRPSSWQSRISRSGYLHGLTRLLHWVPGVLSGGLNAPCGRARGGVFRCFVDTFSTRSPIMAAEDEALNPDTPDAGQHAGAAEPANPVTTDVFVASRRPRLQPAWSSVARPSSPGWFCSRLASRSVRTGICTLNPDDPQNQQPTWNQWVEMVRLAQDDRLPNIDAQVMGQMNRDEFAQLLVATKDDSAFPKKTDGAPRTALDNLVLAVPADVKGVELVKGTSDKPIFVSRLVIECPCSQPTSPSPARHANGNEKHPETPQPTLSKDEIVKKDAAAPDDNNAVQSPSNDPLQKNGQDQLAQQHRTDKHTPSGARSTTRVANHPARTKRNQPIQERTIRTTTTQVRSIAGSECFSATRS